MKLVLPRAVDVRHLIRTDGGQDLSSELYLRDGAYLGSTNAYEEEQLELSVVR